MTRRWVLVVCSCAVAAVFAAVMSLPADAQIPITSTTTTTRPRTTTSTTRPSTSSTTARPGGVTSTTRRAATSSTTTTAPPRTTSTIATPAPAPTTTTVPQPVSNHTGAFSPVFTWLAVLGFVTAFGLLALQWFLTRPGRQGWTL